MAKLKKQLKKAEKNIKKGDSKRTATAEDIEDLEKRVDSLSAFKRKKTGLQSAFVNMEKVLRKMEAMQAGGVDPVAHRKKWVTMFKLNKKTTTEVQKGWAKLRMKMGDEAKYKAKNFNFAKSMIRIKAYPPKNRACENLVHEADAIVDDINNRIVSVSEYFNSAYDVPPLPKNITVEV
jgi:hypothetical protein